MNVSLTPELEKLIAEKVRKGMYHSASEVVGEALRLLQERDEVDRLRRDLIRRKIAEGLEQLDRGEAIPGERVFEEIRALRSSRRRSG